MQKERFAILLISLLLLFVLRPFLQGFEISRVLLDVLFTLVFITGINAISERRKHYYIALAVFLLSLIAKVSTYIVDHTADSYQLMQALYYFTSAVYLIQINVIILIYVVKSGKVTRDKICAAICVYLLMGVTFGMVFSLIETVEPGSFVRNTQIVAGEEANDLTYYSYVTLTTLGYGDITPTSEVARSFSILEAVLGQLYLAVLIARLVGLHIVHQSSRE